MLTGLNLKQAVFLIGEVYMFGAKIPIREIGLPYLFKLKYAENLNNVSYDTLGTLSQNLFRKNTFKLSLLLHL